MAYRHMRPYSISLSPTAQVYMLFLLVQVLFRFLRDVLHTEYIHALLQKVLEQRHELEDLHIYLCWSFFALCVYFWISITSSGSSASGSNSFSASSNRFSCLRFGMFFSHSICQRVFLLR